MVRVALDLTPARSGETGVARYAVELERHLRAEHPDVELATFAVGRGPGVHAVDRHVRMPLRFVHRTWAVAGLPRAERLVGPVDVVHATDMEPAPSRARVVVTVHDILPLRRPELYLPRTVRVASRQARVVRQRADLVLATCHATAAEIADVLGIAPDRVVVTGLGHRPPPPVPPPPLVDPPYVLYVGALTPRKGLGTLADAIARLGPASPTLVAAGPVGHHADPVIASLPPGTLRLGRVADDDLDRLYAHATVLCHPSEAEGFGMPVLEALAFGRPVVAADIPSVREVAGDAATLVPAGDAGALADALAAVLADPAAASRAAVAGPARAARFTWSACAAATAAAYRALVP